ncbi:MAG: hypothetical protein ACREOP_08250 [Thermodesulfobacteriota bacterium]
MLRSFDRLRTNGRRVAAGMRDTGKAEEMGKISIICTQEVVYEKHT